MRYQSCLQVAPSGMEGYTWWQRWDQTGSKPRDRMGRRKEPKVLEKEGEDHKNTGNRDEAGARAGRKENSKKISPED